MNPILRTAADLPPMPIVFPFSQSEEEKIVETMRLKITSTLQSIGVEFKEISLKDIILWYQLYKGEIFHIMPQKFQSTGFPLLLLDVFSMSEHNAHRGHSIQKTLEIKLEPLFFLEVLITFNDVRQNFWQKLFILILDFFKSLHR